MSVERKHRPREPERAPAPLTPDALERLIDEGREMRRVFDRATAASRRITPDDLKLRSR